MVPQIIFQFGLAYAALLGLAVLYGYVLARCRSPTLHMFAFLLWFCLGFVPALIFQFQIKDAFEQMGLRPLYAFVILCLNLNIGGLLVAIILRKNKGIDKNGT